MGRFGDLSNGINNLAVVMNRYNIGWRGQIPVPEIVMNCLVMPNPFPGSGIQGNNTVGEKIFPMSVSTIKIIGGGACGNEYDTAARIQTEAALGVGSAHLLPSPGRPGVMAEFSWLGDGVENPFDNAGMYIICPHMPRRGAHIF